MSNDCCDLNSVKKVKKKTIYFKLQFETTKLFASHGHYSKNKSLK